MSLEPYRYRPATPEYMAYPSPSDTHSRNTSGSSLWSSPESISTQATTPSPIRHQNGPTLLPKIRTRDQGLEPEFRPKTHRRALSSNCNPPEHARPASRPGFQRSTTSPPECSSVLTPISATSTVESWANTSALNSPYTLSSSSTRPGHSRSTSTPAADAGGLRRYVNPTYRTMPVYTTRQPRYQPALFEGLEDFVADLPIAAPATYRELTPELCCSFGPTTTIMKYLTGPNPAVRPLNKFLTGVGVHAHCWWDIRNLQSWDDFNLDTIKAIPGFCHSLFTEDDEPSGLLQVPVEAVALPNPPINYAALEPSSEVALQDIINRFYAAKINAAIKTCQGHTRHITMQREHSAENGPYFISAYANDVTQNLSGKGRLVGIVKGYNMWNTGMRHEKGNLQCQYLSGLAHIQRLMREHDTRYGYIITEIELVCVRMGTEEGTPYFGLVEVCDPIALKTQDGLTAGLALWYLHMLTGDEALPGQCHWKIDTLPPQAMSRSKVLPEGRDPWMQRVGVSEMRNAKTRRGWAMPEDKYNRKKENPTVRTRTAF
ncbi:hypothetical protein OEA41_010590 [Lepraria neglecta]|uniref:Sialidase n=1 Tax=Lepraria neglecta TaxID=209136 RepID=A0AAD9YZA5_9LECA|nr:hypothetical protein OEA41_010590 [Lepraria neglecta]